MSCSVVHPIFLEQQQKQKLFVKSFMKFLSRILRATVATVAPEILVLIDTSFNFESIKFTKTLLIHENKLKGFFRSHHNRKHAGYEPKTNYIMRAWRIPARACVEEIFRSSPSL